MDKSHQVPRERTLLRAELRTIRGKKVKELRSEGLLPVQLYGQGIESKTLQVSLIDFEKVFKETGETNLLDLEIGDTTHQVYIRNIHFGNTPQIPLHADFYYIDLKQANARSDAIGTTDIIPPSGQPLFKLSFAAVSLILLFLIPAVMYAQRVEQKEIPAPQTKKVLGVEAQKVSDKLPARLRVPAINLDANVQHVGVNIAGEMDVPSNPAEVGWFKKGPLPGEKGSSVIAGHFDSENGTEGVFTDLNKLKIGDKLYVEDNNGKSTTFIVSNKRLYDPGYADEVFSKSDSSHLNLITCDGAWDKDQKSYSKRLVVFADIQ